MALYALYIRFTDDTEKRLATRPVHREWLRSLYDSGKVVEAGPFTDDAGAIIVYDVENLEAAKAQFAQDPYSIAGGIVDSVTFHEWNRVLGPKA